MNDKENKISDLQEDENIIKMIWNDKLQNCDFMFSD